MAKQRTTIDFCNTKRETKGRMYTADMIHTTEQAETNETSFLNKLLIIRIVYAILIVV
jgi:hypothetical protein